MTFLKTCLITTISAICLFAKSISSEELLAMTFAKYRKAQLVEISVEKTLKSEWKPKDQVFQGKIFYSQGKFRWENETPEKNLTVYDGKTLWNIQYSTPDFPGKNKVIKSKIDKKARAQILLMSLIDTTDIKSKFKLTELENSDSTLKLALEPLTKDQAIHDIKIQINSKDKKIMELSFKDDIGNTTEISFLKEVFKKKKSPGIFNYKPGKNDEVSEI